MEQMFFQSWWEILRTILVGGLAYLALIVSLRISGKRTLTKLNAFDLVVTVALGSTLSSILLDESISLAEGVVALAVLIFLQFAVSCAGPRSRVSSARSRPHWFRRETFNERSCAKRELRKARS